MRPFVSLLLLAVLLGQAIGGCPSLSSIYNPGKVNCPKCSFLPVGQALKGTGSKGTLNCPKGYEVWFYNEKGQEFVAPSAAVKSTQLDCKGSVWVFKPSGKEVKLSAIACAKE